MLKVYGIKNCSTVKKALNWLEESGFDYEFFDFKKYTPTDDDIQTWKKSFGDWPVNKKGRTFKAISEDFERANDSNKMELIKEKTSSIKRPIIVKSKTKIIFGFNEDEYSQFF